MKYDESKIITTNHATDRMLQRGIYMSDIIAVINNPIEMIPDVHTGRNKGFGENTLDSVGIT